MLIVIVGRVNEFGRVIVDWEWNFGALLVFLIMEMMIKGDLFKSFLKSLLTGKSTT